ncbi:MAG: putative hydro-lyase [Rhodobacterales bacterium]|nr:putative hydro-lyase [Rhodobacterales bacterium]MDX5413319.1 putative hydro-lyase [Rhodobacterales bacterium]
MAETATRQTPHFETAADLRLAAREGRFAAPTSGHAKGYQQGNVVILPRDLAADFLRFCVVNPKPAPILGVSEPGDPALPMLGDGIDIRTDVPRYRVFRDGEPAEQLTDIRDLWRDDFVSFVIGCSFSFETALLQARIPVRHIEAGRNVPMYVTNIQTHAAGPFGGPMVVSMRGFSTSDAIRAMVISAQMPQAHGAPVHFGDPAAIGIRDIHAPEFGDAPIFEPGDVPVFWACGVTPQSAIRKARPALAIMHEPGHMLVTDLPTDA